MASYSSDNDGKFIPASQRPDGTWRKARRVKDGYVPQEEVPLYESKGKQFANRQSDLPVGMSPQFAQAAREKQKNRNKSNSIPGIIVLPKKEKVQNKNSTNKSVQENQKSAASTTTTSKNIINLSKDLQSLNIENEDLTKTIKKLKKKIREIETIEAKMKSGELKKPEKDQIDKLKRKDEILQKLKELEKTT